jgi:acyl-coenzyme A thioesterase PaaI-like protein
VAGLPEPVMTVADLAAFFRNAFPGDEGPHDDVIEIRQGWARLKYEPALRNLRPGNLVTGPTQMGMADRAAYAVILAHIGPVAMAVTSNLNFSFLRGVQFRTLHADARLLKLGRRLATVDVTLWQDDPDNLVGQATITYALPG